MLGKAAIIPNSKEVKIAKKLTQNVSEVILICRKLKENEHSDSEIGDIAVIRILGWCGAISEWINITAFRSAAFTNPIVRTTVHVCNQLV